MPTRAARQGPVSVGETPTEIRYDFLIAVLITVIALFLRLYQLGIPSLWVDEAASLAFSKLDFAYLFTILPAVETNPPAYFALLKAWTSVAGTSEVALRMPSALASAAAVFALFFVALWAYGCSAAIVAAGFMALSGPQVAYAQEARVTAMVTLLVVLGLGLIHNLIARLQGRRRVWPVLLPLALVVGGLPNLHYSGFFVVLVLACYGLILLLSYSLLRRGMGPLLIVSVLTLIVALPPIYWNMVLLDQNDSPVGWLKPPSFWDAKYVFHQTLGHGYLPFGHATWLPDTVSESQLTRLLATRRLAEVSLFLICATGLAISLRQKKWSILALVVSLAVVVVLYYGVSQVKPILIQRTVLFAVPMLALIVGYSVSVLRWRPIIVLAGVSVLAFQAVNLSAYYPRAEKEAWRSVFADAAARHDSGGAVVFASGPYMSPTISSIILAQIYWADFPRNAIFTLSPAFSQGIHSLGLSQLPDVQDLDLDSVCTQLAGVSSILIVYRFGDEIEALGQSLRAAQSRPIEQTNDNGEGIAVWSSPQCPS